MANPLLPTLQRILPTGKQLLLIAGSFLLVLPTLADRLYLRDGESLKGVLVSIDEGRINWHSAMLGDLSIELRHVAGIDTDTNFDLKTTGRELDNCWMYREGERQLLHCDQGVSLLRDWKLVVAGAETLQEPPPRFTQLGNLVLAFEDSSGNNNITKYNVNSRNEFRYADVRHTLNLVFEEESAENTTTRSRWRTGYQFDQFLSEQWFAAGNAFYEEDEFREIESRSSIGAGLGYQFLDTAYIDLRGQGTVNYLDEQFTASEPRQTPALLWNLDLAWRFNDQGMELFHRHALLKAWERSDDWEATSITGFRYPINGNFSSVLQLEYDYDNLPAEAAVEKLDSKWSVGLNYSW